MARQMLKARRLPDLVVVDAEILKQQVLDSNDPLTQEAVYGAHYVCYYCEAIVRPFAIGLNPSDEEFTRSPQFSLLKHESHVEANCDYLKQTSNSETGSAREHSGGPPIKTYPNRLSLHWLNSSDDKKSEDRNRVYTSHNEFPDSDNSNYGRGLTVSSISPLVEHFLEPGNRCLRLCVRGANVNIYDMYDRVFERICFSGNYNQSRLRIYFAQLIYSKISRMHNKYTFFLTDGRFENGESTPDVRSELVVDASSWSSQDIKHFKEKIATFERQARELTNKKELKKGQFLPWIFFLGYANPEDGPKLLCDDLRLIELCITEKLNDISELPPLGSKSSHDNNEPKPNKPILKKKNDKVNSDSAELSSQSTDVQEVSESIFDRQAQTYSEPDNKHELELSRPNEDPLGQMQRTHDEIHRRKEMRTRARQQKQIQVLGKRAWKAVKGVFRQLMNFLRGR